MNDPYDDYMEVSHRLQEAEKWAVEAEACGKELMKMESAYQCLESENAALRAERDRLRDCLRQLITVVVDDDNDQITEALEQAEDVLAALGETTGEGDAVQCGAD